MEHSTRKFHGGILHRLPGAGLLRKNACLRVGLQLSPGRAGLDDIRIPPKAPQPVETVTQVQTLFPPENKNLPPQTPEISCSGRRIIVRPASAERSVFVPPEFHPHKEPIMSAQTIDFQADPRAHRESGFVPQPTSPDAAAARAATPDPLFPFRGSLGSPPAARFVRPREPTLRHRLHRRNPHKSVAPTNPKLPRKWIAAPTTPRPPFSVASATGVESPGVLHAWIPHRPNPPHHLSGATPDAPNSQHR